jgi:hypothetical protein
LNERRFGVDDDSPFIVGGPYVSNMSLHEDVDSNCKGVGVTALTVFLPVHAMPNSKTKGIRYSRDTLRLFVVMGFMVTVIMVENHDGCRRKTRY